MTLVDWESYYLTSAAIGPSFPNEEWETIGLQAHRTIDGGRRYLPWLHSPQRCQTHGHLPETPIPIYCRLALSYLQR